MITSLSAGGHKKCFVWRHIFLGALKTAISTVTPAVQNLGWINAFGKCAAAKREESHLTPKM